MLYAFIKRVFFLAVFWFAGGCCFSQSLAVKFHKVDSCIFGFSKSSENNFDSLMSFVGRSFPSNREKVRAFYTWIGLNVVYDKELLDSYKLKSPADLQGFSSLSTQHPDTVLKYRKAVCEGFCLLMNRCCERFLIPARMVIGVTRMEGVVTDDILHAWNVINPDSAWFLADVTWSNGYVDPTNHYVKKFTTDYFFSLPAMFIQNHWPLDPMWQLNYYPVTKNDFYHYSASEQGTFFNFKDSIAAFLKLRPDTTNYVTFLHYHWADPENDIYKNECDHILYNKMVVYMNLAASAFADYQRYIEKYQNKPLNAKVLQRAITLLREPEKYLILSVNYSRNKTFYHAEVADNFGKMIAEGTKNLQKVQSTLVTYKKLIKTLQPSKNK